MRRSADRLLASSGPQNEATAVPRMSRTMRFPNWNLQLPFKRDDRRSMATPSRASTAMDRVA
jgi:hypothetical protein